MKKLNYVIVLVSDMGRSVAFYRDVLGIPLKFESPAWSEFANEGTTIALHEATAAAVRADEEQAGTCRLGFQVPDLDALHRELMAKKVTCSSPPQAQQYGLRQAMYRDPDGLAITIAQPPARGA